MCILAAGVVIGGGTVFFAVKQLESVNDGLSGSAAAAVYQQQQDIDNIFVEHATLSPYFSDAEAIPEDHADRAKVEAISFRILDHFEHIRYQIDIGLFESSFAAWEDYFRTSFKESPILCEMLFTYNTEYDGLGPESLWGKFAASPCSEFRIGPAPTLQGSG